MGVHSGMPTAALRDDREIVLAAVSQRGEALQYVSDALRDNRGIRLAAELNGYSKSSYKEALLPQNVRAIYSYRWHFSNIDGDSSTAYKYFTSEDPLCLLCHFVNVSAEGEARYKMQFDILKQAYDKQWLIPSLASRVTYIADHHPEMQDSINAMFPGYDLLTDPRVFGGILFSHFFNLVQCMNDRKMDALIDRDTMKTMLKLPEDATEQDVLRAVLTKDYDDLKRMLPSTSKQTAAGVSLSGRVSSIFASGGEASDVEASAGDAKPSAEQGGNSPSADEASAGDAKSAAEQGGNSPSVDEAPGSAF